MSYLSAFSPTRDPLPFQKIHCHLVPLLNYSAISNISFQIGTILLCVSFTYQRPIIYLILLYLVLKLNHKVFLKRAKPFAEFTLLFAMSDQCWHTYHKSYITCIDPDFHWVQSITSLIYHQWLYWKFVLDNNFLPVSDFCESLAPILFITSLSKDKVLSVEKPHADFIFHGNVNTCKLSPIESIKTKRCLLLGT